MKSFGLGSIGRSLTYRPPRPRPIPAPCRKLFSICAGKGGNRYRRFGCWGPRSEVTLWVLGILFGKRDVGSKKLPEGRAGREPESMENALQLADRRVAPFPWGRMTARHLAWFGAPVRTGDGGKHARSRLCRSQACWTGSFASGSLIVWSVINDSPAPSRAGWACASTVGIGMV